MATLTKQDRLMGSEYANRVAALAQEAPDFFSKRRVYQVADELRRLYGFSDEQKKEWLLKLVACGCATYTNLVHEMKMPKSEIVALVGLLVEEKQVRLRQMNNGRRGRPTVHISLMLSEPDFITPKT